MAMHCPNVPQVKVGRLTNILDLTLHVQVSQTSPQDFGTPFVA